MKGLSKKLFLQKAILDVWQSYECTFSFRISLKSVRYEKVIDQKNISNFSILNVNIG